VSEGRNPVAELEARLDETHVISNHRAVLIEDQRAEIERLKTALREIANMDDPAISAQQVAADALEGKDA